MRICMLTSDWRCFLTGRGLFLELPTVNSLIWKSPKLLSVYDLMYLNINTIKVKHDKKFGQLPKNSYICRVIIKEMQTYENNYNGMCEP